MKNFVLRVREALLLFFLLGIQLNAVMAQSEQSVGEKTSTFLYDLTFEEETLESALFLVTGLQCGSE